MKRVAIVSGVTALLLAAATACSSGTSSGGTGRYGSTGGTSGGGSSTSAPTPQAATITIAGFKFTGPLTVPAGATVTVSNTDGVDHTVTADTGGSFDVSVPAGQTVTFTAPSTAGTFKYHCSIHPQMHGTLIVS